MRQNPNIRILVQSNGQNLSNAYSIMDIQQINAAENIHTDSYAQRDSSHSHSFRINKSHEVNSTASAVMHSPQYMAERD